MIKEANRKNVREILSQDGNYECIYHIPPYQRAYAWGKNEWEDLFNDLLENDKGYFLGSLICISKDENVNEVIDGQQRLTTLSILLLSLFIKIKELEENFNCKRNKEQNKHFVWLEDAIFVDELKKLRLTPSIQNNNKNDWEYLVYKEFEIQMNDISNFGNRRISKAFEYFKQLIQHSLITENDSEKSFNQLFEFLEKIRSANLIKIITDNEQSAFLLFESLNNRGVPLSAIDLIKNKLLAKLDGDIEQNNEQWQKLINNIGDVPNLQERFLRHYYMIYAPVEKDSNFIIPKITKSNLIDLYSKLIDENAKAIFDNLINKSKIYGLLINPERMNQETEPNLYEYQGILTNLKYLGISSSYMLLTYVFDEYKGQNFTDLLDYLEFWFICRHATNTPPTNELDKIFANLIQTQKSGYDFEKIQSELNKFIDKENVEKALKSRDIYENTSLTRAILIRLEKNKRNKQTATDFWKTTDKGQLIWSIEHIYPQNPKNLDDWGNTEENNQLKEMVHSLGNLTITGYNSNYSNKSYYEKCNVIDKDNKPVGLKNGDIKINEMLPEPNKAQNTWTVSEINNRANKLVEDFLSYLDKK